MTTDLKDMIPQDVAEIFSKLKQGMDEINNNHPVIALEKSISAGVAPK